MEESPFPYQGPLEPAQVLGRDRLVDDLVRRVTSRKVTALLGPRRYGKTSLLGRVAAELTEVGTVWVDLYEVSSMADVAVRFDDALAAVAGPLASLSRRFAVEVALNLGALKVALSGPARARPDPAVSFHNLLQVLVRTAESSPTLLVVDEFSSVARVEGAAGAMRTAFQHHYRTLGLVFAGSQPSMMRTLFSDRPQPFYGQADLLDIGPLGAAALEEIVGQGFANTGRTAGRLAGLIHDLTGGHPQRAMQLADACWEHTPLGGVGHAAWADGLDHVRRQSADPMERLYSQYNPSERRVLRALAVSGSIYGAEAQLLDLAKSTAQNARRVLLDSGELTEAGGELRIVDPVLADWIRNRFPL
ncbi:MAG TPA: ATP-binding protein [Acidimicrobiales bacterium]|nr:ATP-binding protein [Acidimicrobiales bacterium]